MNNYIVQIISPVDSKLLREIEANDCYLFTNKEYHEFINDDNETIACFPINNTIVLRVKKNSNASD